MYVHAIATTMPYKKTIMPDPVPLSSDQPSNRICIHEMYGYYLRKETQYVNCYTIGHTIFIKYILYNVHVYVHVNV